MRVMKFGRSAADAVLRRAGRVASRLQERRGLDADVLESDDEYLLVFDAPGARASDVDVRYDRDRVRVRIDRFRDHREGFEMLVPGRGLALDGSVRLPAGAAVDPDGARARLAADGTLRVFLPKTGAAEADEVGNGDEDEDEDGEELSVETDEA